MFYKLICTVVSSIFFISTASASSFSTQDVFNGLDNIKFAFELGYAPTEWKATHAGWSLDSEILKSKSRVSTKNYKSVYDYHKIISSFFRSTKDYHVNVGLLTTLASSLPFTVKASENSNRYFVAYIDEKKLPTEDFQLNIGDELIQFNGKPVQKEIDFILTEFATDVPLTDRSFAALLLTRRKASNALTVPTGPLEITFRKKGTKTLKTVQLIWEHTPEKIQHNPGYDKPLPSFIAAAQKISNKPIIRKNMVLPFWKKLIEDNENELEEEEKISPYKNNENPHQIGGKISFIPELGKIIWKADETSPFSAYIFKNKKGKLIGYVRVSHYSHSDNEFNAFKAIIEQFKDITDGLVIDQVNNPGGSVFYLYALASVLTDKPLIAPKHRIKMKQETISEAISLLKQLEEVKDNKTARKVLGKTWDGYPVNYQVALFTKQFCQFLLDQWRSGKSLSDPMYLYAADKIMPDTETNYTKPILLLTNSLDFSGGDFFPAILQDNKRVTVLGTRTAGAGGYVEEFTFPNRIGISSMSMTGSIALRIDQNPIENLGVTPDIVYPITAVDLENNYKSYVKKIQTEINKLIK